MATLRYGDIVEINGELFEFTPIGYMPVSPTRDISNKTIVKALPTEGMLTQTVGGDINEMGPEIPGGDVRFTDPNDDVFISPDPTAGAPAELIYLDDIPEMDEDPEDPPSPEEIINQAFAGWDAFVEQWLGYIEDQASDDIDRIFLMEEMEEFEDLKAQYEAGEITAEELLAFEPDYLSDVPGWSEWWEGFQVAVSEPDSPAAANDLITVTVDGEVFLN